MLFERFELLFERFTSYKCHARACVCACACACACVRVRVVDVIHYCAWMAVAVTGVDVTTAAAAVVVGVFAYMACHSSGMPLIVFVHSAISRCLCCAMLRPVGVLMNSVASLSSFSCACIHTL